MKTITQGALAVKQADMWWVGQHVKCLRCGGEFELEPIDNVASLAATHNVPRHGEMACPTTGCGHVVWFYPDVINSRAIYVQRVLWAVVVLRKFLTDAVFERVTEKLNICWANEVQQLFRQRHSRVLDTARVKAFWDTAVEIDPRVVFRAEAFWGEDVNPPYENQLSPWDRVQISITPVNSIEHIVIRLDAKIGKQILEREAVPEHLAAIVNDFC